MMPPRAGPTARDRLNPALFREMAWVSSRRGTSSGTIACQAGAFMAAPRPSRKVKLNSTQGEAAPSSVRAARSAAATVIQAWVASKRRRRSMMSARAPAGSDNRNMGKMPAACTRATIAGEGERDVMSQAAPTLCIKVPILDTRVASHNARNTGCCKGLQDEVAAGGGFMARRAVLSTYICKICKTLGSWSGSTAERCSPKYNHRLGLVMPASFLARPGGEKIAEPPPVRPRLTGTGTQGLGSKR